MSNEQPHVHCLCERALAFGWANGAAVQLEAWRLQCEVCGAIEKFLATDEAGIRKFDTHHAYCGE